jgi:hypothetical protein
MWVPGCHNNPIVIEDSPPSPGRDDIVPAPQLPQKNPIQERSDKGEQHKKSGDAGKSEQDELVDHANRSKPKDVSAVSHKRKRTRNASASVNCEVLAPHVIVSRDREGAIDNPQVAPLARHHHPDRSPEISDHVSGVSNIPSAAAVEHQHQAASLWDKMTPKEFSSLIPLSPAAIKEVCAFIFPALMCLHTRCLFCNVNRVVLTLHLLKMYASRPDSEFNNPNGNSLFEALCHALKCMREKERVVEGFLELSGSDFSEVALKNHERMRSCIVAFIKKHIHADIFPWATETGRSIARLLSILSEIGASCFLQKFIDDDQEDECIPILRKLSPERIAIKYGLTQDLASAFVERCRTHVSATNELSRSSPPVYFSASTIIRTLLNDGKGQGIVHIQDCSNSSIHAYHDEHSYLHVQAISQ